MNRMKNKTTYIKAVLAVFGLLLLTRIPNLAAGSWDRLTLVSTLVEAVFFIWGVALIVKRNPARPPEMEHGGSRAG